jgi:RNA polymerase sigma-70 factor, ECF subfamily
MASPREHRFELLFRANYPAVRAYALRRSSGDSAQDVVAETFLVAWRRLDDVPADALPWLYGVARRVLANQRRTMRRSEALGERLAGRGPALSR